MAPPPPPQAILMDLGRMHRDQERLAADVRLLVGQVFLDPPINYCRSLLLGQVRAPPLGYASWWARSMSSIPRSSQTEAGLQTSL